MVAIAQSIATATDLRNSADKQNENASSLIENNNSVTALDVPDRYAELRAANVASEERISSTKGDKNAPPVSQLAMLQPLMQAVYEQLSREAQSTIEVASAFDVENQLNIANLALVNAAKTIPNPLDGWIAGMTADIGNLNINNIRANIRDAWAANGMKLCESIVNGHYPFDRKSSNDVDINGFSRLFGPTGLFKTFYKDKVARFIDESTTPWRWRGTFGTPGAESPALSQFENAAMISNAFFPLSNETPAIKIKIQPVFLSDTANAVILDIEGERLVYFHRPIQEKSITWPSQQSTTSSRVVFLPGGWQDALTVNGDWSPFRLFDQAFLTEDNSAKFRARFNNGNNFAEFDVEFGSSINLFRLPAINNFKCMAQF